PLIIPVRARRRLGRDLLPGRSVDDEDLISVVVHLLAEVDVVKVRGILIAEKQTDIAMRIVAGRAADLHLQDEIADGDVFPEREVQRAPVRWLIVALLELAIDFAALRLNSLPCFWIGRLPVIGTVFEIILED